MIHNYSAKEFFYDGSFIDYKPLFAFRNFRSKFYDLNHEQARGRAFRVLPHPDVRPVFAPIFILDYPARMTPQLGMSTRYFDEEVAKDITIQAREFTQKMLDVMQEKKVTIAMSKARESENLYYDYSLQKWATDDAVNIGK